MRLEIAVVQDGRQLRFPLRKWRLALRFYWAVGSQLEGEHGVPRLRLVRQKW